MRPHIVFSIGLMIAAAACTAKSDPRVFTLQGQVLTIQPDHKFAEIKHEEIKGFMPAMTMSYEVKNPKLLDGLAPGDLVNAKLVVESNAAYLSEVKKVGSAPLEKPPAEATAAPSASAGFELIRTGEPVPEGHFVDQDGKQREFTSFAGQATVVTFIYTKCPMPTFCPFLDRNFALIQKKLQTDSTLSWLKGRVHLVSLSFDPETDTPAVLKKHAATLQADPRVWTFLTGDRDDIDKFAARFGVQVARAMGDQKDITHNLRTALIDKDGKLVKVYIGNEWSPDQLIADLKNVAPAN